MRLALLFSVFAAGASALVARNGGECLTPKVFIVS